MIESQHRDYLINKKSGADVPDSQRWRKCLDDGLRKVISSDICAMNSYDKIICFWDKWVLDDVICTTNIFDDVICAKNKLFKNNFNDFICAKKAKMMSLAPQTAVMASHTSTTIGFWTTVLTSSAPTTIAPESNIQTQTLIAKYKKTYRWRWRLIEAHVRWPDEIIYNNLIR